MKSIVKLTKAIIIVAMTTLIGSAPVLAGTFVYVFGFRLRDRPKHGRIEDFFPYISLDKTGRYACEARPVSTMRLNSMV